MPATYDEQLSSDRDRVRAMLGDTDTTNALLSNEHIAAVLAAEGGVHGAVAFLANELVATYARTPVRWTADGATFDLTERLLTWRRLAATHSPDAGVMVTFVPATYGSAITTDEYAR